MKTAAVLAAAAFLAITGAASARADAIGTSLTFTVWNGTYASGVGYQAERSATPNLPPTAIVTYTGPIAFVNDSPQGSSDTFADFFGANASGITGVSGPGGITEAEFLALTMSTPGETGNSINSFLEITGTYTASAATPITVYHADGASLYAPLNVPITTVFSSPQPTNGSVVSSTGDLPIGTDDPFDLFYVDTNGAPAVLSLTKPTSVPEPSSLPLLAAGVVLFGLVGFAFGRRPRGIPL